MQQSCSLKKLDESLVIRFDCANTELEIETVLIPDPHPRKLRQLLIEFQESKKQTIILDPSLDNKQRKEAHAIVAKMPGLHSKSDGQKGRRVLTIWKDESTPKKRQNHFYSSSSSSSSSSGSRDRREKVWRPKNDSESPKRDNSNWSPAARNERPAAFGRPEAKQKEAEIPVVFDNSNSAPEARVGESPEETHVETFWVCEICEAENDDLKSQVCDVCCVER